MSDAASAHIPECMKAYQFPEKQFNRLIDEVSKRHINAFFANKTYITGDDILRFCDHEQVNRFILFQVNQELGSFVFKLQHPFFDLQNNEVRDALDAFKSILSRHIQIKRSDFAGLVEKAVYNSLKLLLRPAETFDRFFFRKQSRVSLETFEKYARYFSDFDFILKGALAYQRKNGETHIDQMTFHKLAERLSDVYAQKRNMDIDSFRSEQFKLLTGYELNRFSTGKHDYASIEAADKAALYAPPAVDLTTPRRETPTETPSAPAGRTFDAPNAPAPKPEPSTHLPSWAETSAETVAQEEPTPEPPKRTIEIPKRSFSGNSESAPSTDEKPTTLADKLKQSKENDEPQTLADKLAKQDGGGIEIKQIPLHKQFQFIQRVFSGEKPLFQRTVDKLNNLGTAEAAEEHMRKHILNMPTVDRDDKVVKEFMQLIRARLG